MDEASSLSSTQPQKVPPQQPSSSDTTSSDTVAGTGDATTPTAAATTEDGQKTSEGGEEKPQEQPSTSHNCKREFGYDEAIPFAPWRRKRYALTVQGLHEEIVDMYHWIKPNEIESRLRTKVFEKVRDSVLRRWNNHKKIKISMFGSLRTNLFLPTSDIDVLVECEDFGGNTKPEETQAWLQETAHGLEKDDIAETVVVYGGAFVPIVKMVDRDTRLSIDISFNTVQGVRAAAYISKVKEEFPLIEPLVLLLKQFLHYRKLNQTFTGGLSSYGLVLLLVNFFQLYAIDMRHRTIYDRGVNLGHLLLRFLELYSLEFNYEEMGISPGQACYIPKSAAGTRYGLKRAQPGNLSLEDPLLTANDVGRSTYNFSSIANAFGQALQILMVAVTLRERKGQNEMFYKGSLLHMIMPFTAKELTYRNWLMSGVIAYQPKEDGTASYDLNTLHNTLVSPTIDLSRYAWLRKLPPGYEKKDPRPYKFTGTVVEDSVRNQVLQQLRIKMLDEEAVNEPAKKTETATETNTEKPKAVEEFCTNSGPPLPTSTASVNTSATVSTAASVSEREDTDSPGLSSSLGAPSSEDDEDGTVNQRKVSSGTSTGPSLPVQFKKQFSEVVAAKSGKDCSKRTQTNFEQREGMHVAQQFNSHQFHQSRGNGYIDYAAVAAATPHYGVQYQNGQRKYGEAYYGSHQRTRPAPRNHSQGSDGSDGYRTNGRWTNRDHNGHKGRRGGRAPSNSSNRSRHSSGSTSRVRQVFQANLPNSFPECHERSADATITGNDEKDNTLTQDGCIQPHRKYAEAVKKKSSVVAPADVINGNAPPQKTVVLPQPNSTKERSWNQIAASHLVKHTGSGPIRKDNECGLDTKVATAVHPVEQIHQLVPPMNRVQR